MKFQIERPHVEALAARYPEMQPLAKQLKFGNKAEISFQQLSIEQLGFLRDLYEAAGPHMQGRAAQIATLEFALFHEAQRFAEGELEKMLPAITEYIFKDAIRGWLFKANVAGKPIAYVVSRIDFTPQEMKRQAASLLS